MRALRLCASLGGFMSAQQTWCNHIETSETAFSECMDEGADAMNHMQSMESDREDRAVLDGRMQDSIKRVQASFLPSRYRGKLCRDLEVLFRSRLYLSGLSRIVLFGSCARNEMRAGSDLDLLVLTEEAVPQELKGELCGELEEAQDGISTDLVFYTEDQFRASDCRLVQNIRKDGLILWEAEHA